MTKNRKPPHTSESSKLLPCGRPAPKPPEGRPPSVDASWKEKLEHYLATKELNQSESRNKLIELVLQITAHFTIQDLIRQASERYPQIGAATIYRNIPVLVDAGILKETLTDDSGQKYYEVAGGDHHDHLVCIDCNGIFEFHDEGIEKLQDRLSQALKFRPVKHRHVIFAACGYLRK